MLSIKLAGQVGVIFFLMAFGVIAKKKGIVTVDAARKFSNFVLMFVSPGLIVQVFQRKLEVNLLAAMGGSLVFVILFHLLAVAITHFVYPSDGNQKHTVERILAVCSNCGFMGIPLMTAVMGEIGMLYAAIYVAVFNIYTWTHVVTLLRHTRPKLREILLSPGAIGAGLGVGLFFLQITLPGVLRDGLSYLTALNTPLPTIIAGVFVADISIKKTLTSPRVYLACAMRLVVLPLAMLALLWAIRAPYWFDGAYTVALAAMISCSCSGAITTIMMPAKFGGGDPEYAAGLIAASTAFSIVTIPLVATLSQLVLGL